MEEKQEKSLEQSMEELNGIIRQIEGENLSLEETFRLYKAGMERLQECNQCLDRIEKELEVLEEQG